MSFPPAAQPDIIRSHQKDDVYVRVGETPLLNFGFFNKYVLTAADTSTSTDSQVVRDAMLDMARRLLGPRLVVWHQQEVGALAVLLYHGLNTGAGLQTLGEEYCDLYQVNTRGEFPGWMRRLTLVLLEALAPLILQRVRARAVLAANSDPELPHGRHLGTAEEVSTSGAQAGGVAVHGQVFPGALRVVRSVRAAVCNSCIAVLVPEDAVEAQGFLPRAHLAIFYLFGVYYQVCKDFKNVWTPAGPVRLCRALEIPTPRMFARAMASQALVSLSYRYPSAQQGYGMPSQGRRRRGAHDTGSSECSSPFR